MVLRYAQTSNAQLLQLILSLRAEFGAALVSEEDNDMLMRSLLLSLSHPSVATEQRLMVAEWLQFCPNAQVTGT